MHPEHRLPDPHRVVSVFSTLVGYFTAYDDHLLATTVSTCADPLFRPPTTIRAPVMFVALFLKGVFTVDKTFDTRLVDDDAITDFCT